MSRELERLVEEINERPDPLHGDRTPAVDALVDHGLAALPHILPLLEAEHELTRLRAQRVLEGVTREWVRRRAGERPESQPAARAWQELWEENGPYDWRTPPKERERAVARWRDWLEKRER